MILRLNKTKQQQQKNRIDIKSVTLNESACGSKEIFKSGSQFIIDECWYHPDFQLKLLGLWL